MQQQRRAGPAPGPRIEEPWSDGPGLLESIWRHGSFVAVVIIFSAALGFVLGTGQPATYEAEARMFLADERSQSLLRDTSRFAVDPQRYVPQQAERLASRLVLERAVQLLEGEQVGVDQLRRAIETDGDTELELLLVQATATSAERAAAWANAVAAAYQEVTAETTIADAQAAVEQLATARADLRERLVEAQTESAVNPDDLVLEGQIEAFNQQLLQLELTSQQLSVDAVLFGSGIDLFEEAVPPDSPSSAAPSLFALLGALLGGGLATAYAYRRAARNGRVESKHEPARILQAPLLGEIPTYKVSRSADLAERLVLEPAAAEAFQFLLTSVQFALDDVQGTSVVITSAMPGDGKTAIALHLALTAAHIDQQVLIVDGDVRMRGLTEALGAQRYPGLTEVIAEGRPPAEAVRRHTHAGVSLDVLPAGAGPADPSGFFRSGAFRVGMGQLRSMADVVVVDSPPVLSVADSVIWSSEVDGVIVVINAGMAIKNVELLKERLSFISTPILGYVYNRTESAPMTAYTYDRAEVSARRQWTWRGKPRAASNRPLRPRGEAAKLRRAEQPGGRFPPIGGG